MRGASLIVLIVFFFFQLTINIFADPEDPELVKLPSPSFKSTPAESAFRKRVTINIAKQEFTSEVGTDSEHETVSGLDKTDSAGKEEGRKQTEPTKEDSSMVGAHIRFVLAILLFLGFMIFLVWILMEGTPQGAIGTHDAVAPT